MGGPLLKILPAIAFATALLVGPAAAQDSGPVALAASSEWTLDYAEDSCALRRSFGQGENQAWLEMRQLVPGYRIRITVGSSAFRTRTRHPATVRFLPDGDAATYDLTAYGDYGEDVAGVAFYATLMLSDTPDPPEFRPDGESIVGNESTARAIEVRHAFNRDLVLHTGDLQAPMKAMRACMEDLMSEWGIAWSSGGAAKFRSPAPRRLQVWARPIMNSFPLGLFRLEGPSIIKVRLIIDANGKPEACRVVEPVVDGAYEKRTCGIIMSDAQYEPALDEAGSAVRTLYVQNIVYTTQQLGKRSAPER